MPSTRANVTATVGGNSFFAGKNKIINGDFQIWQRGTSFSLTTGNSTYGADRMVAQCTFSAGSSTYSQQSFTAGTAPVTGYEAQYFARLATGSTTTQANFQQRIEDVRTFAGQTVTVSVWAKSSTTSTLQFQFEQNFGSGGSSGVVTSATAQNLSSSWTRYTATVTLPSISGKTIGTSNYLHLYLTFAGTISSANFDVWGIQVEAGSVATPFETATGTLQGELAACQRYYQNLTPAVKAIGIGTFYSATAMNCYVYLPVEMRTTPTLSATSGTNYYGIYISSGDSFNSFTINSDATKRLVVMYNNSEVSGTAGQSGEVYVNDANGSVGASAEL